MSTPARLVTHLVDLYPPEPRRDTWLAVCSQKDFSRSFLNRSDAIIAANDHFNGVLTVDELERGVYRFKESQ